MRYSISNLVVSCIFLSGFFFLIIEDFYYLNLISKFYLITTYIICSLIILIYLFNKNNNNYIPILPLTCFFFLTCYLSVSFLNFEIFFENQHVELNDINYAIKLLFFGILSMIIGYILTLAVLKKFNRKGLKLLNLSLDEIFLYGLLINLSLIFFYYLFKIQIYLPPLFQVKYPLLSIGFALFTNYIYHRKKFFDRKVLTILFLKCYIILSELISGSYALPFTLIFLDYIYYCYLDKKTNMFPVLIFCLVFFAVHEGKEKFRKMTWEISSDKSYYEKTKLFLKVNKNIFSSNDFFLDMLDGKNQTNRRISHSFESLVIVSSKTPQDIPYWNGYSYNILKSKIIPRILWKDKPDDQLGNEFGHRYGILTDNQDFKDLNTSWNMPVLNEFYVNFGLKGVMCGMLLIGIFFAALTKFFSFKNNLNLESIFTFYLFVPLFFLESHLSILIGALLQSYLFLLIGSIIYVLFTRKIFKNNL